MPAVDTTTRLHRRPARAAHGGGRHGAGGAARPGTAPRSASCSRSGARARDRRLATVLGAAALIGATTSMAVAAQTALPGDSLYPVKRAIEHARTSLANDDADQGPGPAGPRRRTARRGRELTAPARPCGSTAVADTLVTFDEQADEAADVLLEAYAESGDEPVIRSLRSFTATGLDQLSTLEGRIPDSARDEPGRRRADARRDRRAGRGRVPRVRWRRRDPAALPPHRLGPGPRRRRAC